ncbi:CHASE2 domain-containing protein [Candidatus Omnitrophota bacterium]
MKFLKKTPLSLWLFSGALLITILLSSFRVFNNYELITYDLRMKLRPAAETSQEIILVEISDDSLKNLGSWPIPRDFHASLIKVLRESGARAIIFDLIFSEPTLYDREFSSAIKESGNVYLPLAFYLAEPEKGAGLPESNTILGGLVNDLKKEAAGIGHINVSVDPDGKVRRIPPFIHHADKLYPSLALKAASDWLGLDPEKLSIPLSSDGSLIVNYPDKWAQSFIHLSYFEILKAYSDKQKGLLSEIDLSVIRDKACFVGLTATGTSDLKPNPLEKIYPMLGLQASVFNSLLTENFIKEASLTLNTLLNLLILGICLLLCQRLLPVKALLGSLLLAGTYFLVACGLLILYGLWIDLFLPLLIIAVVYAGSTIHRFRQEARKRQLLEKELDIARAIQKSFLPKDISEFSNLHISYFMQPAKFVAGDLYDIVALDDNRLGVLIGDVSGKGVPAALIMAKTISLFRIFSRQHSECSKVLAELNKELCGQFGGRFVTCLYLIIDTASNKISCSSAGHSPLLIYKDKERAVREAEISAEVPLGVMEGVQYSDVTLDIKKGDKLCIFTDGISEARDKKGGEFGTERLKNLIEENANRSVKETVEAIKTSLGAFSRSAPQHDDITLLLLQNK